MSFYDFKTQQEKDVVEIYDGVSNQLIAELSGDLNDAIDFTSENCAIDIRFISDGSVNSEGFKALYWMVSK